MLLLRGYDFLKISVRVNGTEKLFILRRGLFEMFLANGGIRSEMYVGSKLE